MALYDSVSALKKSLPASTPEQVVKQVDAILADVAMNENYMESLRSEFSDVYEAQFKGIRKRNLL